MMPEVKVEVAAHEMGMSKFWFYRLPRETPGLYQYGRALRVDVEKLREFMKKNVRLRINPIVRCEGENETTNPRGSLSKSPPF